MTSLNPTNLNLMMGGKSWVIWEALALIKMKTLNQRNRNTKTLRHSRLRKTKQGPLYLKKTPNQRMKDSL